MVKKVASPAATRFEGFPDADGKFFKTLAKNQNKVWWEAHKAEYQEGYQQPMSALLGEVRLKISSAFDGAELGEPKIFRIFRDVRFSKDKTPYKTFIGGYIPLGKGGGGEGPEAPAPLYLQVGTENFAGSGCWMMDAAQLERFRQAVADEGRGKELTRILGKLEKAGFAIESHETLKKVPRDYDPEHPRADLLKRKSLTVRFPDIPRDQMVSRTLIDWLSKETKKVAPLIEWFGA